MAITTSLLTAKDFLLLSDHGQPTELIHGKLVHMNVPAPRHGQICAQVIYLLRRFLDTNDIGHVVSNDAGVVTARDPDTVRGVDVAFFSYAQVPRGPLPQGYLPAPPELVFEVRSRSDRWRTVHAKVGEYLEAGVSVVCVLDEQTQTAHIFGADQAPRILAANEEMTIPEVLGEFRVVVRHFFE